MLWVRGNATIANNIVINAFARSVREIFFTISYVEKLRVDVCRGVSTRIPNHS
jgi:hypothetical protein